MTNQDQLTEIIDTIASFDQQFQNILSQTFIDESLILGLVNFIQPKFQSWILSEVHDSAEGTEDEFKSIGYMDNLWYKFHYPITKYFQRQLQSIKNNGNKSKYVELRKVNEIFVKFSKQTANFYMNLLKHLTTHFSNNQIPNKLLRYFNFEIGEHSVKVNEELEANLIYLAHKCILFLGDLSRHRTFVTLNYTSKKDDYSKAIELYNLCIMILPGLSEPYNNIGMIYNINNDKTNSIYYFMRASMTRITNQLNLSNLNSIISKTNKVNEDFDKIIKKFNICLIKNSKARNELIILDEMNRTDFSSLVELGFLVIFERYYNKSSTRYSANKLENEFFNNIGQLDLNDNETYDVLFKQLVILIGGFELLNEKCDDDVHMYRFKKFIFSFCSSIFEISGKSFSRNEDSLQSSNNLSLVRITLNWFKENKSILKNFHKDLRLITSLSTYLNILIASLQNSSICQDPDQTQREGFLCNNSKRPRREYFYLEDIQLKDFKSINYQLKDFNDDSTFKSSSAINLLNGEPPASNIDLENGDRQKQEINARINSVLVLGKKLIDKNVVGHVFDSETCSFISALEIRRINDRKIYLSKMALAKGKEKPNSGKNIEVIDIDDDDDIQVLKVEYTNDRKFRKETREKRELRESNAKKMSLVELKKSRTSANAPKETSSRKVLEEREKNKLRDVEKMKEQEKAKLKENKKAKEKEQAAQTLEEIENKIFNDKFKYEDMVNSLLEDESSERVKQPSAHQIQVQAGNSDTSNSYNYYQSFYGLSQNSVNSFSPSKLPGFENGMSGDYNNNNINRHTASVQSGLLQNTSFNMAADISNVNRDVNSPFRDSGISDSTGYGNIFNQTQVPVTQYFNPFDLGTPLSNYPNQYPNRPFKTNDQENSQNSNQSVHSDYSIHSNSNPNSIHSINSSVQLDQKFDPVYRERDTRGTRKR